MQVNDSSPAGPQQIPAMRLPREIAPSRSATPLYDELCAEYRRLGRALPGDRSGEEHLRFAGSGTGSTVHGAADPRGWRVGRPWRVALPPAVPGGADGTG